MSERSKKAAVAERVEKHRSENKLKSELAMMKQQLKRSQILASSTPEAERMRTEAAERKRRQRMREKEEKAESTVVRRMSAESRLEMSGDSYPHPPPPPHHHHHHHPLNC